MSDQFILRHDIVVLLSVSGMVRLSGYVSLTRMIVLFFGVMWLTMLIRVIIVILLVVRTSALFFLTLIASWIIKVVSVILLEVVALSSLFSVNLFELFLYILSPIMFGFDFLICGLDSGFGFSCGNILGFSLLLC